MKNIGDPIERRDGRAKVTGAAKYAYEHRVPSVVYGVLVTSSVARGRIVSLDASRAEKEPGVIAVLTPHNALRLPGEPQLDPPDRVVHPLQDDKIHYSNQPIALAVADTFERALHAALLVKVRVQTEPHTVRLEDELANAFPHELTGGGRKIAADETTGDVERGLREGAIRIEATYETPPQTHNPMEPHATIAHWTAPDRLLVYDSTQWVFSVQRKLAKAFAIPEENVRVIAKFVGGAFGCKGSAWSHVVIAALAAKQVKRPLKLVLTRQQMFGPVGGRPPTLQKLALAASRNGKLTALSHRTTSATSRFDVFVEGSALQARHLYESPSIESRHRLVRLDIGTPTFMRAPGESSGSFALESALDELSRALKIDPLQLRLRNHADEDPMTKRPFSSKSLKACYELGAAKFGWSEEKRSVPGFLVGRGMATAAYPGNFAPAQARARLNPDGTVLVESGTIEVGNGAYTVMAQVAADALGVPVEKVRFDLGDSTMPQAPITAGSISAASVGSAVLMAARALREKIEAAGGIEKAPRPLEASGKAAPGEERKRMTMLGHGAQFAEVHVDPDLGMVRVARLVGAFACGRVLNARTARSQLMGGMVWGIGMALHEHSVYDERLGRIMSRDLADYHVAANKDVVSVEPYLVEEEDAEVDPAGVKGMGEIGICGVAAAIANAVFDATGKRIRALPITPDKLL